MGMLLPESCNEHKCSVPLDVGQGLELLATGCVTLSSCRPHFPQRPHHSPSYPLWQRVPAPHSITDTCYKMPFLFLGWGADHFFKFSFKTLIFLPWLVWLSVLCIVPQSERSLVWFLIRTHVGVVGRSPVQACMRGKTDALLSRWCFSLCLSLPLPLPAKSVTDIRVHSLLVLYVLWVWTNV